MASTMVPLTSVDPTRADRDEYLTPEMIGRIEPWRTGPDGRTELGAQVTLRDNDDTVICVAESAAEVTRRRDAAMAAAWEPSSASASGPAASWVWLLCSRLPWRAITVFAWGWAAYQIVRIFSLLQDMVYEHIRVVSRDWETNVNDVAMATVSGVAGGITVASLLLGVIGIVLLVTAVIDTGRLVCRWWRSRRP